MAKASPTDTIGFAGDPPPNSPRAPKPAAPLWNVPYNRNPHFTGRTEDLDDLATSLNSGDARRRVQAIYGLGGIGKTQLALEYAYRNRDDYVIVWWISADEPATLALQYAKLATRLGLKMPEGASLDDVRHILRRVLDERSDWLLIFDNAAGPDDVRNYIPPRRSGHVLITSRNPNWGDVARPVQLKGLKRFESIEFLSRRTHRNEVGDAATRLAQALGDLPLALEQAAACIEQTRISFLDYLQRFETHWAELLKTNRPGGDYPDTVAMTWELSFRQVTEESPPAGDLLNLCAFIAPDNISRDLLRRAAPDLPGSLGPTCSDPVSLDHAIGSLLTYSIVDAGDKTISVHRLVGALARDRLTDEERQHWAGAAVAVVAGQFKFDSQDVSTWERCAELLPHALAAAGHAESLGVSPRATISLLEDAGRYLLRRAQYGAAKYALERALALSIKWYGETHPRVSSLSNNLGRAYNELGAFADAQACYERALMIDKTTYGESDPHVATVVNNYGVSLHNAGDVSGARRQFEWALSVYEMHYGADHAKVASVVNNLGYVLHGAGDLEGARAHFERALTISTATSGPRHPVVASILTNLGIVLRLQGKFEQAREHFEKALQILQAAHGENHPAVARAVGHLGALMQDLSMLEMAREHFEHALRIDEAVYGPDHVVIAARLNSLGKVLKEMDDLEGASRCFARAAAIQEQSKCSSAGAVTGASALMTA